MVAVVPFLMVSKSGPSVGCMGAICVFMAASREFNVRLASCREWSW